MNATIVAMYRKLLVVSLNRVPRRAGRRSAKPTYDRALATHAARCLPGPYLSCCPLRPGTACVARGTRWPLLEHLQHPVGDDEAADRVRRREQHGEEAGHPRQRVVGGSRHEDRSD